MIYQLRPEAPTTSSISTKPCFSIKKSALPFFFESNVDRDKSLADRGISGWVYLWWFEVIHKATQTFSGFDAGS